MRLIVGLGNPEPVYHDTPHNAGFVVCDRFAERHRIGDEVRKFRGGFRRGRVAGEDIGVLKPETYMNLSGESVIEAVRYLPLECNDVIVVSDDMDLPSGRVRVRPGGGHGGHNGIRSVIEHLGTQDFPRIRVGVGRPPGDREPTGYLLSKLPTAEQKRFVQTVDLAVDALDSILKAGVEEAMNRYNGLLAVGQDEKEKNA